MGDMLRRDGPRQGSAQAQPPYPSHTAPPEHVALQGVAAVLRLQRAAGNRAVSSVVSGQGEASLHVQRLAGVLKESRMKQATVAGGKVQWTNDAADNAVKCFAPAKNALDDAKVPRPTLAKMGGGPYAAMFDPESWRVVYGEAFFEPGALDLVGDKRDAINKRVGWFYHEAVHTDQYWLALRFLAHKQKSQALSKEERGVWEKAPERIRRQATEHPLELGGLALPATRKKYEKAAGRAASFVGGLANVDSINARKRAPKVLLKEIRDKCLAAGQKGQFTDDKDKESWDNEIPALTRRIQQAVGDFKQAWVDYASSELEKEAYGAGRAFGGGAPPDNAKIQEFAKGEEADLKAELGNLRVAIEAIPGPPPPAPPLGVQSAADPGASVQRHAVPEELDQAIEE